MSYDTSLTINTGIKHQEIIDCGNYTYNCGKMLFKATQDKYYLSDLDGFDCKEVVKILTKAITVIKCNYSEYEKMNPENGWGNIDSWLKYLENIKRECKENPNCKLSVS